MDAESALVVAPIGVEALVCSRPAAAFFSAGLSFEQFRALLAAEKAHVLSRHLGLEVSSARSTATSATCRVPASTFCPAVPAQPAAGLIRWHKNAHPRAPLWFAECASEAARVTKSARETSDR
jgi:hypothetical protein